MKLKIIKYQKILKNPTNLNVTKIIENSPTLYLHYKDLSVAVV
jgi:hypothetical protein